MYFVERFLMTLKSYVRNRRYVEASIAGGYLAKECMNFCSRYLIDNVEKEQQIEGKESSLVVPGFEIFTCGGRPLKGGKWKEVDDKTLQQATRYVLFNCDGLKPYMEKHINELKARNVDARPKDIDDLDFKQFPLWFKNHSKFEFDVEKEKFVIASISKKWKDHNERLKSRYFKVDGDNPCPLQYLESDQWENLVRHWKSEQGKEEKMGQQMSLIQTFKMMYTKKNGEPSTSVAAEKFVEIDNILASQTNDGSDNNANAKESEILSEVLGKEHPGKPRCYGSFVSSTDVYGPKNKHGRFQHNCPRVQQMEEEFVFMKNKMLEMETHYKSLEEKLSNVTNTRNQQVNHECANVPSERSNEENDIFHSLNGRSSAGSCVFLSGDACYLLGFTYNRVAEGKILNKDPSKVVDGIPLGDDYYEVQVTKVLCPNMRLPTNLQKTLGQCEGESILWIKSLLLEGIDEERS